jgi:hypothetical protein
MLPPAVAPARHDCPGLSAPGSARGKLASGEQRTRTPGWVLGSACYQQCSVGRTPTADRCLASLARLEDRARIDHDQLDGSLTRACVRLRVQQPTRPFEAGLQATPRVSFQLPVTMVAPALSALGLVLITRQIAGRRLVVTFGSRSSSRVARYRLLPLVCSMACHAGGGAAPLLARLRHTERGHRDVRGPVKCA